MIPGDQVRGTRKDEKNSLQRRTRTFWEGVMFMFIIFIMVVILRVYTYAKLIGLYTSHMYNLVYINYTLIKLLKELRK